MTESKAWDWEKVKTPIWLQPCEESYFYAKRWQLQGRKSILDLGCGLGRHAILFAQEQFKVTAVDLSNYAVDHLIAWQEKEDLTILTKQADMKSLPFRDNAFDAIWAYHVISHTDTLGFQVIFEEIKRLLKPDGEVFLTLCSKENLAFKEGQFPEIDENSILKTEGEGESDVPHYYVDMDDIQRLFQDWNLDGVRHIDDCYYDGAVRNSKHYFITASRKKESKALDYTTIIGKKVKGTIDRPLGTAHPQFPSMIYPINYGYVDGIMANDGDEQDVYLFGETEAVESFEGTVIAVVHRFNDVEEKWIVSKDDRRYSEKEINDRIHFQEKYYDSILIMS